MSTMLSTDGIMDISSGHSSTKIHHAPGGKTSIDLFGGYDKAEPAAAAAAVVVQAPATPGRGKWTETPQECAPRREATNHTQSRS